MHGDDRIVERPRPNRRAEDIELWGREMDHDDWVRGSYGPSPGRQRSAGWIPPERDWRREDHRHWHGHTPMRGWQRSDERVREDVCAYLSAHPGIDTSDMEVTVSNGEVTLEGTVDDRFEKRMAEDLAEAVPGVRDVHNRLRLSPDRQVSPPRPL